MASRWLERKPASPSRGVPSATCAAPSAACGFTASGGAHPAIRSGPIGTSSAREPPTPAAAVSGTDPSAPPQTTKAAWRWRSSYRSRRLAESGSVGAPSSSSCTVALRTASALRIHRSRSSA